MSTIEKALNELHGVQTVNVDLAGQTVTVSYGESIIELGKIKKAIEDAGYDVV